MADSFYNLLGVNSGATPRQIRDAFRRLAREHHPDVNPGDPKAEDRFKRINEAYHVLSDEKRRKDYDEFGDNWARADDIRQAAKAGAGGRRWEDFSGSGFSSGFGGLGDLLGEFGFQRGPGRRRREAQTLRIDISLLEAFKGAIRLVSYRRAERCRTCGGGGHSGEAICAACSGHGATERPVRLEVKIPAGIEDGGKIRLRPDAGTEIIIQVRIEPDKSFRRTGSDLHTTVSVPYTDIVLGGEVSVPTMNGSVVLKIPPGTQNGRVFRLAGKGMPAKGKGSAGALYATVSALFPERISEEEQRLFERLRGLRNGAPAAREPDVADVNQ